MCRGTGQIFLLTFIHIFVLVTTAVTIHPAENLYENYSLYMLHNNNKTAAGTCALVNKCFIFVFSSSLDGVRPVHLLR
jgi:hypothetical protein